MIKENILILCCYTVMLGLFSPVLLSLWHDWSDSADYSHGFLIIPVSLYIAWQKRHLLRAIPFYTGVLPLSLLVISLFGYLIFFVGDIAFLTRICMIFVFAAFLIIHLGYENFKIFLFPTAYLFFMIPPPASLILPFSLPLRLFASNVSTIVTHMLGVPVLRSGNVLSLPAGILEVAPACSGLRSLFSLIAISALVAYMIQTNIWKKLFCFFSAIPVAIVANIFRISSAILLFHYVNPDTARGLLHDSWGMIVFLFSTFLLVLINILVKRLPFIQ